MPDRRRRLAGATAGCFVVGAVVLLLAEATVLHIAGTLGLIAAMACGVFLIADPEDLGRDDD